MITHEEIRDRLKKAYSNNRYLDNITIFKFHDYINKQEKKDKLLELYKEERSMLERYINGNYQPMGEHLEIIKQIKVLEEELK